MAPKRTDSASRSGKFRMELRLDMDIAEKLKTLTEGAGVSINQFVQTLIRWAVDNGHVGRPVADESQVIRNTQCRGIVWFGDEGRYLSPAEMAWLERRFDSEPPAFEHGQHLLTLDFTEGRAVRRDVDLADGVDSYVGE